MANFFILPKNKIAVIATSSKTDGIRISKKNIVVMCCAGKADNEILGDTTFDLKRSVVANSSITANTKITGIISDDIVTDTKVKNIVSCNINLDVLGEIIIHDSVNIDIKRDIALNDVLTFDISRNVVNYTAIDIIQYADFVRNPVVNNSVKADLFDLIHLNDSIKADVRIVYNNISVTLNADLKCKIETDIGTIFSLKRKILNDVSYNSSLLRRIPFDTSFTGIPAHRPKPGDPFHVWPAEKPKPGPVSIEINLNEQTLSDSFALETTQEIDINNMISGRIIDFDYVYQIGDVDWIDLTRTAGGMYDVDEILYRMITYKKDSALNIKVCAAKTPAGEIGKEIAILGSTDSAITNWYLLSAHAARIGNALNKRVVFLCDNFKCNSTWTGNGNTYQSIISTLFGWSSSIPHMMINVFMRAKDNTLYVVQRGHELSVIDINDTKHTRPHIKKTLERTAWSLGRDNSGGGSSTQQSGGGGSASAFYDIDGEGGTAKYTEASSDSSSSSGGGQTLLSHEETEDSVTDYHYDADGHGGYQLMSKVTRNKKDNSRTETTYHYDMINGGWMMTCEKETNYSPEGVEQFTRKTTHIPIGNGGVSTHVYEGTWGNMKLISSSVSEGTGVSNQYRAAEETYALTKSTGEKKVWDSGLINLPVASVGDVSNYDQLIDFSKVPTDDKDVLLKYTKAVMWLNRKVRETVEMDIYEYNHVVDFTERVRFRGNEYYLSSNKISQTTRELKQTVTLVRWY